jgi:hypothetical protein
MEDIRMTTHASATFEITGWDEHPYAEWTAGCKLTRARVNKVFHGDIEGESSIDYLMAYSADGSAHIVGMERLVGRIAGRSGSVVLQHDGTFADGRVTIHLVVVPGSGTDALHGLRGAGGFKVGHTAPFPITLDYDLA